MEAAQSSGAIVRAVEIATGRSIHSGIVRREFLILARTFPVRSIDIRF